jgi:hypothetical protein
MSRECSDAVHATHVNNLPRRVGQVATPVPRTQAEHSQQTRDAYDLLAGVWSATTDDGPFNGQLERPALRALLPGLAAPRCSMLAAARARRPSGCSIRARM